MYLFTPWYVKDAWSCLEESAVSVEFDKYLFNLKKHCILNITSNEFNQNLGFILNIYRVLTSMAAILSS